MRGESLPVEGGFDVAGRLTRDPAEIEASKRPLPIGYWKGSGMALLLDIVATLLCGGCATFQIPADTEKKTRLSQVFIAIDPDTVGQADGAASLTDQIVEHLQSSPHATGGRVRYPGERVLQTREENLTKGTPETCLPGSPGALDWIFDFRQGVNAYGGKTSRPRYPLPLRQAA